jgi:2-amino-4-hydroxy-6-hydroxymethyldihydropteridine diphosphokinase
MPTAYISAGSNIKPRGNIARALRLLSEKLAVTGVSAVYRTKPELGREQPDYYNCVIAVRTALAPGELQYGLLRDIEKQLGRRRSKDKFASRPIDLDLIAYGSLKSRLGGQAGKSGLVLPSPEIKSREYLAAGLAELKRGFAPAKATPSMKPLRGYTKLLRKELRSKVKSGL